MTEPATTADGSPLVAGVAYFAVVFAIGFLLGTIRTLLLEPSIGAPAATLVEAPLMMLASYLAARALVRRVAVAPKLTARLAMGATALFCLLTAEAVFSGPVRGWTFTRWLAHFGTSEGLISLVLFGIFAAIPALWLGRQNHA